MGHPSPHVWYVTPGRTVTPRMFHSSSYMRSAKEGSRPLLTTGGNYRDPPSPAAVLAGIGAGLLFMHYNDENRAIRQVLQFDLYVLNGSEFDSKHIVATQKDLKGNWTLLHFGYTSSPDVGPAELSKLTKARKTLPSSDSKQNLKVQPLLQLIHNVISQSEAKLNGVKRNEMKKGGFGSGSDDRGLQVEDVWIDYGECVDIREARTLNLLGHLESSLEM
ncbi:protein SCO1 homolog 2, mitochondrial isoform X1 [Tanacetum coccineum]|uniref:Protein SCO1 homolog 2, mitochondrial isoform X1 n=1 Tax=Tanacetum coccineum TaxID=301880 RepID=A0ABQ5FK77_9ASTR